MLTRSEEMDFQLKRIGNLLEASLSWDFNLIANDRLLTLL